MRARRVAILLAVTALSALTLFLVSLMDAGPAAAAPDDFVFGTAVPETLSSYEEMVIVGPDGDAHVEITVVIGRGGLGDLLLPFDFENGEDFNILSGPAEFRVAADGTTSPTTEILGRRSLNLVRRDSAAGGDTIRVSVLVPAWFSREDSRRPFGEYFIERRFVNSSVFVLRDFRLGVTLPPGMAVHEIERVVPDFAPKQNPKPPYSIDRMDGRVRAVLGIATLPPTGAARLDLNARPERRGWIPLVGGIITALLYLVFFRDVLKPRETE